MANYAAGPKFKLGRLQYEKRKTTAIKFCSESDRDDLSATDLLLLFQIFTRLLHLALKDGN